MAGYKAFYKGREHELYADSYYEAQQIAAKFFKARNRHEVTVVLYERDDGTEVVHSGASL